MTEPFATLIKEKTKSVETRSWKTNYRGPLYIHASMTKISKNDLEDKKLMSLIENKNMNFGNIICKCDLVDCIYMTKEYVIEMKDHNYQEYICGEYEEGRYAWVLDNITPLEIPIKAKGQLGIWNYYNEFEIMDLMNTIEYGWMDKNKNIHTSVGEEFLNEYTLQSPNEIIKNKIGTCWDQVELERYYFKGNNWNIKTYFTAYDDNNRCPTHTFLTFEKNNKYYWFEHAWERFSGIQEYDSEKELLLDIRDKFITYELNNEYEKEKFVLCEYKKPKSHISVQDFYDHCSSGKYINIEKL